jgi:predicted PurR-regulated permease PerM
LDASDHRDGNFIVIQNLEGLFYAPRIVRNYVGLHPMTVIVSIFVWGLIVGGVIGPLLAVPLTATLTVLFGRYVSGRHLREQYLQMETAFTAEDMEVATHRSAQQSGA